MVDKTVMCLSARSHVRPCAVCIFYLQLEQLVRKMKALTDWMNEQGPLGCKSLPRVRFLNGEFSRMSQMCGDCLLLTPSKLRWSLCIVMCRSDVTAVAHVCCTRVLWLGMSVVHNGSRTSVCGQLVSAHLALSVLSCCAIVRGQC